MSRRLLPGLLTALLLSACASDPPPDAQLRLTEQAVVQARSMDASEDCPELLAAEQKLHAARLAMHAGDHRAARMQAEQAELDARLAEVKVLKDKRQAQIDDLNRRIERLRPQLGEVR